jgi:L-lactate dehydrogenase (cytochrome)/(S)-mandelate dehydrogenase
MRSDVLSRKAYSIGAMRGLARRALPQPVFDFADGGAEDETTRNENERAFTRLAFSPRTLAATGVRDQSVEIFGGRLSLPVIIGPTGLQGLFWPDGEFAEARAAAAAGSVYCLSHGSVCSLEELARSGIAGRRWMQIYVYRDRGFTRELTDRSAAAGYEALILTVDNQATGSRERDLRNGFTIPPRFSPAQLAAMATKVPWLWRMKRHLPRVTFGNYRRPGENADLATLAQRLGAMLDSTMTWADIDELRSRWKGPLLLKGVLNPAEAVEAMQHGVDGIIVSNHGGRQLDGAITTIEALPRIAEATGGRIPLFIDSGVRRGGDVIRAMALGASACLIGRPHVFGLSVAGEAGVARVLEIFRSEIDRAMALCGLSRLVGIPSDLVLSARRSG